jgi:hypothetical protein
MNNINDSQSHILIEIERLVQLIADSPSEYYLRLYQLLTNNVLRYLSVYDLESDYSEYIELFWHSCQQAGIFNTNGFISEDQFISLVQEITSRVQMTRFKRRVSDRRYQTKQNYKSIHQYARSLHGHYSRLLVVRVDWYYRMECQHLVGIDTVYEHLELMKSAKYHNPLFEHLVGGAWCIEQGVTRGYHLHTVYYFLGSKHQSDWYMAQQIGQLWERITQGLGTFHSCNTPTEKDKYDQLGVLGVGMIHRNDRMACENAIHTAGYLADYEKEDQYLRMKPKGRRAFATGIL